MTKYQLGNNISELERHFITRINEIVKSYGKQLCVWEGFRKGGKIVIPGDIVVFEFETAYYLPNELLEDGYQVVNASWKPLYVHVAENVKWDPSYIYEWNIWRWENWNYKFPSYTPIQCDKSDLVTGAQMCSWNQPYLTEFPSLRRRLAALSERAWIPDAGRSTEDFLKRLNHTDNVLSKLTGNYNQDILSKKDEVYMAPYSGSNIHSRYHK